MKSFMSTACPIWINSLLREHFQCYYQRNGLVLRQRIQSMLGFYSLCSYALDNSISRSGTSVSVLYSLLYIWKCESLKITVSMSILSRQSLRTFSFTINNFWFIHLTTLYVTGQLCLLHSYWNLKKEKCENMSY